MVPLSIPGGNNAGAQLRNTAMLATWVQVCMTVQFMMTTLLTVFIVHMNGSAMRWAVWPNVR